MWPGGIGKPALTEYRTAEHWGPLALLDVSLHTGRTHQIRVHLQSAGFPIAGDDRYGDADANSRVRARGLERLFLHAQSISFPDEHGNELHFTAPLPDDLNRFLSKL